MRRFVSDLNPLVRGLAIVALIALVVIVLDLGGTVTSLFLIAQIAFPLAIAYFVFLMWRERRSDIETWPERLRYVFYAAIVTLTLAVLVFLYGRLIGLAPTGLAALAFVLTLALCAWSAIRAWRDAHTYGD